MVRGDIIMQINSTFRFHKVGQGLFYSGILTKTDDTHHNTFSFIYDCGSESSNFFLYREIDEFKHLFPSNKRKLDMLVISHLHEDHVNGLERLLDGIEVQTVVMPYINDGLKLLARLELRSDDEFLKEFYTDPVAWFVSKGAKRVLLLGSEEEEDIYGNIGQQYYEDQDIHIDGVLGISILDDTQIVYLKKLSTVKCWKFYWGFCFENLKLTVNRKTYIEIVEDFKKQKCLTLEQIFKSKRLTQELRRKIEKNYPNAQNRTSVVLLHRPIKKNCSCLIYFNDRYGGFLNEKVEFLNTILTGDIELRKSDNLELLSNHDLFCVFQYPHHGSKNNDLKRLSNPNVGFYIISCGIINRYGHPHNEILEQIQNIVFVNERNAFDYQIIISECKNSQW